LEGDGEKRKVGKGDEETRGWDTRIIEYQNQDLNVINTKVRQDPASDIRHKLNHLPYFLKGLRNYSPL
jgi:hypothetical protein